MTVSAILYVILRCYAQAKLRIYVLWYQLLYRVNKFFTSYFTRTLVCTTSVGGRCHSGGDWFTSNETRLGYQDSDDVPGFERDILRRYYC